MRCDAIAPLVLLLLGLTAAAAKDTLAPAPGPRHDLVRDGRAMATIVVLPSPTR